MNTPVTDKHKRRVEGYAGEMVPAHICEELERDKQSLMEIAYGSSETEKFILRERHTWKRRALEQAGSKAVQKLMEQRLWLLRRLVRAESVEDMEVAREEMKKIDKHVGDIVEAMKTIEKL